MSIRDWAALIGALGLVLAVLLAIGCERYCDLKDEAERRAREGRDA